MCGICGFSGQGDLGDLSRMMTVMTHRGPDGSGQWSDGTGNFLGHLRLSIVDLEGGKQPLSSPDGAIVVVFNGEIYNHRILRRELEQRGHQFHTDHSDTEVLIYGYKEWGFDVTTRLNGMWAFAIIDLEQNLLWLSRDRFGKKPLFYAQRGETIAFASELNSLASHSVVEPVLDRLSLKKYFAYGYIPAPGSILSGVNKLPAGHNLFFNLQTRTSSLRQYWRLNLEPDDALAKNPSQVEEMLVDRLYRAVETRLEADVPVGVFISGGIDSSAVLALALSAKKGKPVRSFSIGFEEQSFDESGYSSEIARILGTKHRVEKLPVQRCLGLLESIYTRLDEPLGDSSLVPSFLMCKLASEDIKVALGGDGSDELFAGYDPFRALRLADIYTKLIPKSANQLISNIVGSVVPVSHKNMSLDFKIKRFLSGLGFEGALRNAVWMGPLPPGHLSRLFGEPFDIEEVYSESISAWDYAQSGSNIDRTLQFYSELYLQNDILTKMDRAGMLNSLEVRCPFLDFEFVDVVRRLPARLKFDGRVTKKILKQSLYPLLPLEILNRSKKGFGMPIGKWFRDNQIEINPRTSEGILDHQFVDRLRREHTSGKADWRSFLWAYYGLEQWLDQNRLSSTTL